MYNDSSFAEGFIAGSNDNRGYNNGMFGGDWAWILILLLLGWGNRGWGNGGYDNCCGCGGYGFGGNGFIGGYDIGKLATTNDVAVGFNNSAVLNNLNDIKLGQNSGFANVQQTLCQCCNGINQAINTNGYETRFAINGLSSQLAQCCCDLGQAIQGVNYNMATNTCNITNAINNSTRDIIDNQNANYRAIHDELVANKIEAKNERIAELTQQVNALNLAQSQANQNAYLTATMDANTAELIRRLGRSDPQPSFLVPNPYCCYTNNCNNSCCGNNGF